MFVMSCAIVALLSLYPSFLCFDMFDTLSGFVVVWLHSTPMKPCLDVTTWDALP